MDTDAVISEIGTAMKNLLEKDVHGFTWDLENKVKKNTFKTKKLSKLELSVRFRQQN